MKQYGDEDSIAPLILNFGIRWRCVARSMPWTLYLWEKSPRPNWLGGWVGPIASLDTLEYRMISCPCKQLNYNSSAVQHVAYSLY